MPYADAWLGAWVRGRKPQTDGTMENVAPGEVLVLVFLVVGD